MKLYVVCLGDCEGMEIKAICKTKQIAERELFKVRDELIKGWEELRVFWEKEDVGDVMYKEMIQNISTNDYEKWDNFPHESPYLYEMELMEE